MKEFVNSTEHDIYKSCMQLSNKYWDCKDDRPTWENLDNDCSKIVNRYKDKDSFRFVRSQVNTTRTNIKRHLEFNSRFDGIETNLL
jgi:spore maturation protein CgeB